MYFSKAQWRKPKKLSWARCSCYSSLQTLVLPTQLDLKEETIVPDTQCSSPKPFLFTAVQKDSSCILWPGSTRFTPEHLGHSFSSTWPQPTLVTRHRTAPEQSLCWFLTCQITLSAAYKQKGVCNYPATWFMTTIHHTWNSRYLYTGV